MHDGALWVADLETGEDTVVAEEDGVTFGLAEFIATEEMGRSRGYWWSPDGTRLLVARVDESTVHALAHRRPGQSGQAARRGRLSRRRARRTPTSRCSSPTSARPRGRGGRPPHRGPLGPDHRLPLPGHRGLGRRPADRRADPRPEERCGCSTGSPARSIREDTDPQWTDIIDGVPAQLARRPHRLDRAQRGHPAADRRPAGRTWPARRRSPRPGSRCGDILGTDGDDVLFRRSTEPTEIGVWRYGPDGLREVATDPGVHTAQAAGGDDRAVQQDAGEHPAVRSDRYTGRNRQRDIASLAEEPNLPRPDRSFLDAGPATSAPRCSSRPGTEPGTQAAGADGPVRRPACAARAEDGERLPRLAVVRGAGLRGRRRGRPRHAGPRPVVGPDDRRRLRHAASSRTR